MSRNDEYVGYLNPREPVGAGIASRISMAVTVDPARDQQARLVLAGRALRQDNPREWLRDMLDWKGGAAMTTHAHAVPFSPTCRTQSVVAQHIHRGGVRVGNVRSTRIERAREGVFPGLSSCYDFRWLRRPEGA